MGVPGYRASSLHALHDIGLYWYFAIKICMPIDFKYIDLSIVFMNCYFQVKPLTLMSMEVAKLRAES